MGAVKKKYIKMTWYGDVWQCSNISLIFMVFRKLMSHHWKPFCTIVEVGKRLPCIFDLCAINPLQSILYNFSIESWVVNCYNHLNLLLILAYNFKLILLNKWFEECSINYLVLSCDFVNIKSITVGTNSFYNLVRFKHLWCKDTL